MAIETERMVSDVKTFGVRDVLLSAFNFGVEKLLNPPTIQAHQMVVVLPFVQFINRFTAFELAAGEQSGLLKLHQHAVDGGQSDVSTLFQHQAVNVFGAHVALAAFLEQLQYGESRQGGFEARVF